MNYYLWIFVYCLALIGHMSFWIGLFNRMHGTSLNIRWIRRSSYPFTAMGVVCLPIIVYWLSFGLSLSSELVPQSLFGLRGLWGVYIYFSSAMFFFTAFRWLLRQWEQMRPHPQWTTHRRTRYDFSKVAQQADRNGVEKFFAAIPGNQIYQCVVEEREIRLPMLGSDFNGLTITHLTDFHLTGNICAEYFENVIQTANDLGSDLMLITGDIIDSNECWSWIQDILGKLSAPLGVYYILGNHDQRIGREQELRKTLDDLGWTGVADRWHQIKIGNHYLHLAGNELPWFGSGMTLATQPPDFSPGDFRLLMSHSPDQFYWAKNHGFDLVLAGHTHGGQIRIPGIGPIVAPSKYGVRFASGVFAEDGKVMVVSRGVSGEEPIRLYCPPEIGKLTIQSQT